MEPLGQSQIFQYLQKLAQDHVITLVTYEKKRDWDDKRRREVISQAVKKAGIRWIPLRYHKRYRVLATAYDLAIGFIVCIYSCICYRVRIVHARGYIAAVFGLGLKRILNVKFVFDIRGFWADSLLEFDLLNKSSLIYRVAKWFERCFLLEADVVVSLTQKAVEVMQKYSYLQGKQKQFEVITTCTNIDLFRPISNRKNYTDNSNGRPFTFGYVGSAGPSLYLFDPVLECYNLMKRLRPDVRLLIINRNDHSHIRERLRVHGIGLDSVEIKAVDYQDVPGEMGRMDAGIFFIAPLFSSVAAVPTKMGEFLACGVPCLANAGVGNVEEILENNRVGVVIQEFGHESLGKAVERLLELVNDPDIKGRCVFVAQRFFLLETGVREYDRIYRDLMMAMPEKIRRM